jgi:hypothetical protein
MNTPNLHTSTIKAATMPWLSWPQTLKLLVMEAKLDLLTLWRTPGFVSLLPKAVKAIICW